MIDKAIALSQIDEVLERRQELGQYLSSEGLAELTTLAVSAIKRLSPPGSPYLEQMETVFGDAEGTWIANSTYTTSYRNKAEDVQKGLQGILRALRADYAGGRLQSFLELVHADLFSDFLDMAEYLLGEDYKDAAAVIAGGVLEEHLRKLCVKYGVQLPTKPTIEPINVELVKVGAYGKNEQKQVTAWASLRNDAAHGQYSRYTADEIGLMATGLRDFVSRHPA